MTGSAADRLVAAGMSTDAARQRQALLDLAAAELAVGAGLRRWFVPGRVEVLGKHTDYAGGRSLLCTVERGFSVAARRLREPIVRVVDATRHERCAVPIAPDAPIPPGGWTAYPAVVARRIARDFPGGLHGAEIAFASDLPPAAGLSSSSALVVAIYTALAAVNGLVARVEYAENIQALDDLAGYLGCVENGLAFKKLPGGGGVGTFGGSEDHTAILVSEPGRLKQYSFCPVRFERTVGLPPDCAFAIAVSGVVADKAGSAKASYNRASQATRTILDLWNAASSPAATSLAAAMTADPSAPERLRSILARAGSESRWLQNRFEQFLRESEVIIPRAGDALARGDLSAFGTLVDESQAGAESLLGNQIAETIWLARRARELGAHAASAFGAGFGGSVWALVPRRGADDFVGRWRRDYASHGFEAAGRSEFFVTPAGPALVSLD